MTIHGAVAPDDTFICNACHKEISKPVHPALAGKTDQQAVNEAMQQVPTIESKDKLWGEDGMFLCTMHATPNGFLPGVELINGVNEEDARRKLMNRVRNLVDDPNCVRIVTGVVLTEMRRPLPPQPVNRINGHDHGQE